MQCVRSAISDLVVVMKDRVARGKVKSEALMPPKGTNSAPEARLHVSQWQLNSWKGRLVDSYVAFPQRHDPVGHG